MSRSEDLLKDLHDSLKRTANATMTEYSYSAIAATGGGTEISAAQTGRVGLTIMNNTDGAIFVGLGDTNPTAVGGASSSYSGAALLKLSKALFYEVPYRFTGRVAIIKHTNVTVGSVVVTEIS
jgi:hypothetical protein